ncbi:radical SAM/SPASM domain-containing protein [Thermaerobacter subterraneus]|uniref:Radical SAM additional 4Fe4S-binding domain protein n=1 Tax=Thermaerobacter subterraneus DSM 13965 TaxID=867903 RepID=K6Q2X9_9FIRM|nr:radical SAM protein [Thermaerobacter subterraneus]EKP95593.1 radical SAM additional 4Fe4S-binding domain protein [Thermaerobacter subterraneus DSM 13965]
MMRVGQHVAFNYKEYTFNRFKDEAYLFHRRERKYTVFRGLVADLIHLIFVESATRDLLYNRLNAVTHPGRISREQFEDALTRLAEENIVVLEDVYRRTPALPGDTDAVTHVRHHRDRPYFYAPLAANLFINGRCNQRCSFCFLDFGLMAQQEKRKLSCEEWLAITDELIHAGVNVINIGGMEPFLDIELTISILEKAYENGCIVGVITNGSISLSSEQMERLAAMQCYVGVSLEAHVPTVHNDLVNARGAFQQCVANIEKMIQHGVPVGIQTVALRSNMAYLEQFVEWLEELGVKSLSIQNIFAGPWCSHVRFFDLAMTPAEYRTIVERAKLLERTAKIRIEYEAFPHERPNDYYTGPLQGIRFRLYSMCSAGKTAIQVSPTGDLSPCPFTVGHSEHVVGNLLANKLLVLWHDSAAFGPFRKTRREDYASVACRTCEMFDICRGGCLITARWANGGYLNGDPRCSKVWDAVETLEAQSR